MSKDSFMRKRFDEFLVLFVLDVNTFRLLRRAHNRLSNKTVCGKSITKWIRSNIDCSIFWGIPVSNNKILLECNYVFYLIVSLMDILKHIFWSIAGAFIWTNDIFHDRIGRMHLLFDFKQFRPYKSSTKLYWIQV